MENVMTLPPQINGRVFGYLTILIEEVTMLENVSCLSENFNILVQVQWWGQILPIYLRPKVLRFTKPIANKCQSLQTYFHAAKYAIKTKTKIFESYLKSCEVLELVVLEEIENMVIGSAFLKDLITLFTTHNHNIMVPFVNYLGDAVGEIKIYINFIGDSHEVDKNILKRQSDKSKKFSLIKEKEFKEHNFIEKPESIYSFSSRETVFNSRDQDFKCSNLTQINQVPTKVKENNTVFISKNVSDSNNLLLESNNLKCITESLNQANKKISSHDKQKKCQSKILQKDIEAVLYNCSPEIKSSISSSEVLCNYSQLGNHNKKHISNKNITDDLDFLGFHKNFNLGTLDESNFVDDSNSGSIKKNLTGNKENVKAFLKSKESNFQEIQSGLNDHKFDKILSVNYSSDISNNSFVDNDFGSQNLSLTKYANINFLKYIFGAEMDKKDEERALNYLQRISPSYDFVNSIGELYTSENNHTKFGLKKKHIILNDQKIKTKKTSGKIRNLSFNLSDPIEKLYYEKFFIKSISSSISDIAEVLNEPKSSPLLENSEDNNPKKSTSVILKDSDTESKLSSYVDKETDKICLSKLKNKKKIQDCTSCTYCKKLKELEATIESLKQVKNNFFSQENVLNKKIN